jgi:hypothetical protein
MLVKGNLYFSDSRMFYMRYALRQLRLAEPHNQYNIFSVYLGPNDLSQECLTILRLKLSNLFKCQVFFKINAE